MGGRLTPEQMLWAAEQAVAWEQPELFTEDDDGRATGVPSLPEWVRQIVSALGWQVRPLEMAAGSTDAFLKQYPFGLRVTLAVGGRNSASPCTFHDDIPLYLPALPSLTSRHILEFEVLLQAKDLPRNLMPLQTEITACMIAPIAVGSRRTVRVKHRGVPIGCIRLDPDFVTPVTVRLPRDVEPAWRRALGKAKTVADLPLNLLLYCERDAGSA